MRLIDADALDFSYENVGGTADECSVYDVEAYIASVPTIEAEPVRHGRWITHFNAYGLNIKECSQCGHYRSVGTDGNYCANCGARMDAADTNNGKGGADNG